MSLKAAIHNALWTRLSEFACEQVEVDTATNMMEVMPSYEPVCPVISELGPGTASFTDSESRRCGFTRNLSTWTWSAKLWYEATIDESQLFDYMALPENNNLGPVSDTDTRQPIALLDSVEPTDPPRQSEQGTSLEVTFNIKMPRT